MARRKTFFPITSKNSASGLRIVRYACGGDGEAYVCAEIGRKIEGERERARCVKGEGGGERF
jgi:hypothetical protein